jgi:hypothetical protein
MQTIAKLTTVIFIGLAISCCTNKKSEGSKVGNRIIDNSYILTQPQRDSILTLIDKLEQEI